MVASSPDAPEDTTVDPAPGRDADPGAATQVLGVPAHPVSIGPLGAPVAAVSRRVAAEIGMYCGALLVLLALGSAVVRGWSEWESGSRWATAVLAALALLAPGLWARVSAPRPVSAQRRRAVSAMVTCGTVVGVAALGVATDPTPGTGEAGTVVLAVGGVVAGVASVAAARSPLSETWLLVGLAWACWLLLPRGPVAWGVLTALGAGWALAACGPWVLRGRTLLPAGGHLRGRRTALVVGPGLALLGGVALATGPWAWPARLALLVVAGAAFTMFRRGGANHWLALAAGSGTALVAAVAGDVLGPALALLMGGVATMGLSWLGLRSAP